MDLNNIELSSSTLANLYANHLVESTVIPAANKPKKAEDFKDTKAMIVVPAVEENTGSPWRSLGNNQQSVLIIVNDPAHTFLSDHELSFLTGILGACKLTIADVAIINIATYPGASYKELTAFFKSRIVLLFSIEPSEFGLPMNFPHYQIQGFANNSFLYSPSLKELEHDRMEKSKLWVSLKRLFNL